MSYSLPVAVLLTLVFTATGVGYLVLLVLAHDSWPDRLSRALHVVMSVAMALMSWDWGMELFPAAAQAAVFAAGTVYYLVLLAGGTRLAPGHAHSGRVVLAYHVVMMAAMVVMAVMMGAFGPVGGAMGGMEMGGHHQMSGDMGTGWTLTSLALGAVFVAGAAGALVRSARARETAEPRPVRTDLALLVAMSAGMAVAFVAM